LEDQDPEDNGGLEERGKKIGIELGTSCGERSKEEANCLYDWCDFPYDVPGTPQGTSQDGGFGNGASIRSTQPTTTTTTRLRRLHDYDDNKTWKEEILLKK